MRKVRIFYLVTLFISIFKKSVTKLNLQEDIYWMKFVAPKIPWFKTPTPEEALDFAMEYNPRKCFFLNNDKIPFGIHAWYKYDLEFWRPYIEREGYELP